MFIYDSVKKQKLKLNPEGDVVRIYLCGPTVYDDAHLGHAKSAISFDMLRRTLIALGYKVKFVRNYTDIDDKILKKMSETGKSMQDITSYYITSYENDMKALNVLEPDIKPKATEYVTHMIEYINNLIKNDYAYILDDGVYFDTSKDEKYLSISNKTDDEQTQARVENNQNKRDKKDFVLWKFDENFYEANFGKGRPGWHSECVVMIKNLLDNNTQYLTDIHAGGSDLLFPHHENEATQCRCSEKHELSKYWMHNGFIQINNEKMSKSLNNSFFVKDALKSHHAEVLRFYLLSVHYRANFNYSDDDLQASKKRLDKIYRLKKRVYGVKKGLVNQSFKDEILNALRDDLNTSKALACVDELVVKANDELDKNPKDKNIKGEIVANLEFLNEILGIAMLDSFEYFQFGISDDEKARIQAIINKRNEAKKQKDFALSDALRDELSQKGISLMDTPNGTMWEKL